ncbi:BAG family molecular chaperone regulator 7-like [Triticum dicoccoides]|uniref:BAG family molecular chaperone regulator 7-like n=1 Tax=Triticum dicoccoides TaxID=85692 RepID=UPI001890AEF3|nr:BAG family molecular chaperone regulator 7-like [Triticum dicoccoides]
MGSSHRHLMRLLDDPFFPFPPPPPTSLDLYLPADPFFAPPSPHAFLLHDLTDRVAALELAARAAAPQPARRKYTYAATEPGGRKVKWTAEEKPRGGGRALKWEAELASPNDDGFDRKWRWEAKSKPGGKAKTKWGTEIKGKGSLQPWSHAYTWEEDFAASDDDDDDVLEIEERKPEKTKKEDKPKKIKENDDKKKKKPARTCVQIEEIPEDNSAGCDAIRKAFAMGNGKGKAKELSPQDAALLIQMNYRAHLAHRSQVLRCLRDLAVAKAKLKELRSLFYNLSYRRRLSHDHEERQRFSEKIIVLLLTVDALEGPDFMVRTAKKSMLEELESMLEIVDPQPPGKQRSFSRRKFDLPEGGAIPNEKTAGVNNAVRVINTGKSKQ